MRTLPARSYHQLARRSAGRAPALTAAVARLYAERVRHYRTFDAVSTSGSFYVEARCNLTPYGRPVLDRDGAVMRFERRELAEMCAAAFTASPWGRNTTYAAGSWPPAAGEE